MIHIYNCRNGQLVREAEGSAVGAETVWIDLVNPTADDEALIEQALGIDVPTKAQRDIQSLMEHTRFLTNRVGFLLDATLGMISTEQNQIIKLFSVMAVMMMPPTLVASIYGINLRHMPELEWPYGYPLALGAMVLAAIIPYAYFRRKGWL